MCVQTIKWQCAGGVQGPAKGKPVPGQALCKKKTCASPTAVAGCKRREVLLWDEQTQTGWVWQSRVHPRKLLGRAVVSNVEGGKCKRPSVERKLPPVPGEGGGKQRREGLVLGRHSEQHHHGRGRKHQDGESYTEIVTFSSSQ